MNFDFMYDPRWLDLDSQTKNQLIEVAFMKDVASDPRWKTLPEETKSSMKNVYLQEAYKAEDEIPVEGRTLGSIFRDVGVTALKAAKSTFVDLPIGAADMFTMGGAGKTFEEAGYDSQRVDTELDTLYSDAQKKANRRVERAEGFVGTTKELLLNPSVPLLKTLESLPQMVGGQLIAKGLLKSAPKALGMFQKAIRPEILASALGEGAISAMSQMESTRQLTEDGYLTPKQIGMNLLAGVGTGAIAAAGARLSQWAGVEDPDVLLLGALRKKAISNATDMTPITARGVAKRIVGGGISEGLFQELPQSIQEQVWLNAALDKPLWQDVPEAGAMGMMTGFIMGGAANLFKPKQETQAPPVKPPGAPPAPETPPTAEIHKSTTADEAIAAFQNAIKAASANVPVFRQAEVFLKPSILYGDDAIRSALTKLGVVKVDENVPVRKLTNILFSLPELTGKSPEDIVSTFNEAQAQQIIKDFKAAPLRITQTIDPIQVQRELMRDQLRRSPEERGREVTLRKQEQKIEMEAGRQRLDVGAWLEAVSARGKAPEPREPKLLPEEESRLEPVGAFVDSGLIPKEETGVRLTTKKEVEDLSKPVKGPMYEVEMEVEETGERIKMAIDANKALEQVDNDMFRMKALLDCLGR